MIPFPAAPSVSRFFSGALAVFCLSQCTTPPEPVTPAHDGTYWSEEAHAEGPKKIVISLEEQHVGLFKQGTLVGLSPISSGREGNDTRPGNFKVTEKDEDHRSSWYGAFVDESGAVIVEDVDVRKDTPPPGTKFEGASMNWFMRFNGAIGMHQGFLPGYPASHGCIRLPGHMAELFFKATPHGAPVEVKKDAGLLAQRPQNAPPVRPALPPAAESAVAAANSTPAAAPSAQPATPSRPSGDLRGLRPVTPDVPCAPPAPMTLAPPSKLKKLPSAQTQYLPGFGPQ